MGCFPCFGGSSEKNISPNAENNEYKVVDDKPVSGDQETETKTKTVQEFSFSELENATENFKLDYFLGEGGFGKVYKGYLESINQIVAIKMLDRNSCQGQREFFAELTTLKMVDHPNLVKLLGYCWDNERMLLVYEYISLGSLDNYLTAPEANRITLDWKSRMKIAAGAARGLQYLHENNIIYRDIKCSNVLLEEGFHPKLSDFGLARKGPMGDQSHVSTRVMGTTGYCAPEYLESGQLTFKSDIYSFGVLLLEIITGKEALVQRGPAKDQNLQDWITAYLRDSKSLLQLADPGLEGRYSLRELGNTAMIAARCVMTQPSRRPDVAELVIAFDLLVKGKRHK